MFTSYAIYRVAVDPRDGSSERLPLSAVSEDWQEDTGHAVCWRLVGIFPDDRECIVNDSLSRDDAIQLYEAITGWRVESRGRGNQPLEGLYACYSSMAIQLARDVAQMEHIRDIAEWKDAYPELVAAARRVVREIDSRAA